jgi:hypothetical protein
MIGRNYFFHNMKAYDIKETMYKIQAHLETPLINTIPAHWTREFLEIHKESNVFSSAMWDLIYSLDVDPTDLMWCPVNKCYVHIEWFFEHYGVEVPVPDEVHDVYAFENTELIESLADLSEVPTIGEQMERVIDLCDSCDSSLGSFSIDFVEYGEI